MDEAQDSDPTDTLNRHTSKICRNEKPRPTSEDQTGKTVTEMGLGRLELPTSRLSGPYQTGQIPAKCRKFTGRTYDLPLFPQTMPEYAGIYRPSDRPKGNPQRCPIVSTASDGTQPPERRPMPRGPVQSVECSSVTNRNRDRALAA